MNPGLIEGADRPVRRFEIVATIVNDGLPIEVTSGAVGVSISGFYMWRRRGTACLRRDLAYDLISAATGAE